MKQAIIADENLLDRKKLRGYLENIGISVKSESNNSVHAFNEFRIFKPELVFISLSLPSMDSLNCMKRIKEGSTRTAVILIGDDTDRRQIFEGLEAGADEYIFKPFQQRQIEKVVLKVLKDFGINES